MQGLFKLDSFIVEKIWGSKRLIELKNLSTQDKIGETYEVSTHPSGNSKIDGEDLSRFLNLKYLVKFISTSDNLSIQVHPGDEYAQEHENDSGKTESWIILEANEGAGIYLGFKKGVTKKEFKNAIESGLPIQNYLNFIPVSSGQFFILPAGLVHAIGTGITLCEVQQSSGITYRVWDWDRLDDEGNSRELHIDKALDVMNFSEKFNQQYGTFQKENIFELDFLNTLYKHEDFEATVLNAPIGEHEIKLKNGESLVVLSGDLELNGEKANTYESFIALSDQDVSLKINELSTCILTK